MAQEGDKNVDPPKEKLSFPTKLNISDSNQSLKDELNKLLSLSKRKFSICKDDVCMPVKRVRTEASSSKPAPAPPSPAPPSLTPPSPWEAKSLKIDLIAAKAQIAKLEIRINQQHTTHKEMQILFEEEKGSLMEQHKRDEKAVTDMEDRIQLMGRREQELKDEYDQVIKEFKESKAMWDKEKEKLQKEKAEMRDKLLECSVSSQNQLSEMKKDMDELLLALEGAQSEVEMLKTEVAKQTSRAEQCVTLRAQLENKTFELQSVTNKVKELEYVRDSYNDWQQQAKTAQNRLTNMAELEKEVARLRAQERYLRDCIGNKLLLEEQVHFLQTRVDALQPVQNQLHEAKVKLASVESSLEEWKAAARTHGVENARSLSSTLESVFNNQMDATASSSHAQSQLAQLAEEILTAKFERNKATAKLNELLVLRKNQESIINRMQKRQLLVMHERDSYRQQLDCYEKELAMKLSGEAGAGSAALLAARVQQQEQVLDGYRDLMVTHDPTVQIKLVESISVESGKRREEAESLKLDVARLRAQRDTLQAHLERISAQAQTELTDNRAIEAQKQMQVQLEAAEEEIKKLKATLQEEAESRASPEETQQLKQQLENTCTELQRLKEEFASVTQEYRDVCFLLLGYKIDKTGYKNYRITSTYAESQEEYLTFALDDDGIEMLHTDYSSTLGDLVELHLEQHRSIPLFLSALTIELFTKSTMQVE